MLDVKAMYWKELKDLFSQGNMQTVMRLLLIAAVSIWLPAQLGLQWLTLPLVDMVVLSVYAVPIVFSFVADVFAGERERHTLESLLASPLSNWSIVVGKGAALVTLSWGMTIVSILVSFVSTNLIVGAHTWSFYPLDRLLVVLLLSLTASVLAVTIGILVSLHAKTVRQAQQMLIYGMLGVAVVGGALSTQIKNISFIGQLPRLSEVQTLLFTTVGIAFLDVILVAVVLTLFQRSRLLLS